MTRRRITGLAALIAVCAVAAHGLAQSTIVLRTLVRVPGTAGATLGEIADVVGPEAGALSSLVLVTPEQLRAGSARVDLAGVRSAVEKAGKVNMGRITFSGSSCLVKVAAAEPKPAATVEKPAAPRPEAAGAARDTVRAHVEQRIAESLGVELADLRLSFEDRRNVLGVSAVGKTVAVKPTGTGDPMPLSVRVYQGDALLHEASVRATVLVRRRVAQARQVLAKGSTASAEMLETLEQWLPPSTLPATPEQIAGNVLRSRVDAGKIIMVRDIEPPLVVQRGDIVNIDCLAGTVVVSTTARAKEPAREGDTIQFQSLTSKKLFAARVSGPGRAVLLSEGEKGKS